VILILYKHHQDEPCSRRLMGRVATRDAAELRCEQRVNSRIRGACAEASQTTRDYLRTGLRQMSTYVLIHGACHDGSAWDQVIERMTELGHTAFGPTVAGHGIGVEKQVTHAESTSSIRDFIVDQDLIDVVLVGHSYGGTIISKVAEMIPERIRRLVFWSAFVLNDGESMLEAFPPNMRDFLTKLAAKSADNTVSLPFDVWRRILMNDADDESARSAYARLSPEPFCQLLEPLSMKKFHSLPTPRSYLVGTEDAMPPGDPDWHHRMAGRLGAHRFVEMPGGHELLFSNPVGLAHKIIEAGYDD
jgi:pimeloyl-ACP methyl ester carboxylesterase